MDPFKVILQCEVGSRVHGLNVGSDDRDEMGVCIELPEYVIGLKHFEQYTYRTAEERAKHDPQADQRYKGRTPRSSRGDLDLVIYSLRKYCRLAANGNPSLLILLFARPIIETSLGNRLQSMADAFASRQAGRRFLGYLRAQRERLLGQRGQMRITRTELIEKYGYDTKYAMQACRLGVQGLEYMHSGKLTLPVQQPYRDYLLAIRNGERTLEEVTRWIEELETDLKYKIDNCSLPPMPDMDRINKFLVEAYQECWAE